MGRIIGKVRSAAQRLIGRVEGSAAGRLIGKGIRYLKDNWQAHAEELLSSAPPGLREFLAQHGHEPVASLTVERVPINTGLHAAVHVLSRGQLLKNQVAHHAPKLYHTAIIINGRFRVERNHLIEVSAYRPRPSGELRHAHTPPNTTVAQLLERAQQSVGKGWYVYNPKTSNCQQFDMSVLRANGVNTPELERFVDQGAPALLKNVPDLSAITTAAGLLDRARQEFQLLQLPPQPVGDGNDHAMELEDS